MTGMRADLILLRKNPLHNIRATRSIDGVLYDGRWLDRDDIDVILNSMH